LKRTAQTFDNEKILFKDAKSFYNSKVTQPLRIDEITEIDANVRGRRPKSKKKCTIKRIVRKRSTVAESVAHPEEKSLMPHGSMGSIKTVKGNKEYEITTINK
jgi:hypothetical protein